MHISIIIPALNEANAIETTLRHVARCAPHAERIVVDGGSGDGTMELAAAHARVLRATAGRAMQLNAGARAARGEWLLFLHADTRLPPDFQVALRDAAEQGYDVGAFSLAIRGRHPLLPLLAWGANLRSRWRGIALGDQAPFMRRRFFDQRGGFPELALMEDYAFFRALRRDGIGFYLSPQRVETSGRRWDVSGFWRTWWQMRLLRRLFDRGGHPGDLAARYRHIR
ncbi:MAG: TIGR04283 family arsenosugar biosynthesis glycosyltransferase [Candidatus Lambdaproteobacteria bacterium]|nr:TIGR04283 family arsenosugar biosynthesis glycosyltransferase [Candidatus Lambdaproteobacteria bacterium]